jgi:hypothetical protein
MQIKNKGKLQGSKQHEAGCKLSCYLLQDDFSLGLVFDPEYGGDIIFRNDRGLSTDYMMLYHKG